MTMPPPEQSHEEIAQLLIADIKEIRRINAKLMKDGPDTAATYMEIKTGNLLIVKFMGGKIKKGWEDSLNPMYEFENPPKSTGWCKSFSEKWLSGEDFVEDCYHTSYDWIMPVVSKIEGLGGDENEFDIFGNRVLLCDEAFVGKTKIEAIWKAVVWWVSRHCA